MNVFSKAACVSVLMLGLSLWPRPALGVGFTPRNGFVTLQFDDSHDCHYTYIYPMLESHGFKGTFAFVTEASDLGIDSCLTWKMQEIYSAGHEIQDHTTRHDHMWATHIDTLNDGIPEWIPYTFANVAIWDSLCVRSLAILDSLGISITGWNQPGGTLPGSIPEHPEWATASGASDSLYTVIGPKYAYVMGNYGVWPHNAHLNLRGHNYPQRFPFFNVSHVTIDDLTTAEIMTGIADAVASGLWYCAVSHAYTMDQVYKVDTLMDWLDEVDVEVLRCCDGRARIQFGYPDPLVNQLPQARMLTDLDENGKPDGFEGACAWDTLSAAPVDSCRCCSIWDETEFICYGPEVGDNLFSIWARSPDSTDATFSIAYGEYDFYWTILGSRTASFQCSPEWTRFDTTVCWKLLIEVEDEVDRVVFRIQNLGEGDTILVAYPEFMLAAAAGIREEGVIAGDPPRLLPQPNPVRVGAPLRVLSSGGVRLYDVLGRELLSVSPAPGTERLFIDTSRLGAGVFLISPLDGVAPAKVVVLR